LRFLQEREFERVGGITAISVDVRVIAATNRNLEIALEKGTFREDLYHRLNVVAVSLPPLRERNEDIPVFSPYFLVNWFLVAVETKDAMERLVAYKWPGNVRELANVIERAVVLGAGATITQEHLPSRSLVENLWRLLIFSRIAKE
jgi:transcriptional regulator with PAS, ATPase and Fis domain